MARAKRSWVYDRIVGSPAHLGYTSSNQMVGPILEFYGIPPAPEHEKTTTWDMTGIERVLLLRQPPNHSERHHQGKYNVLLFPLPSKSAHSDGSIQYHEWHGELVKSDDRRAAWGSYTA